MDGIKIKDSEFNSEMLGNFKLMIGNSMFTMTRRQSGILERERFVDIQEL